MCAVFATAFLYCDSREKNIQAVVFKGLASACFVAAGFMLSPGTGTADSIAAGLLTGAAADVVIELKKVFTRHAQIPFLLGCFLFFAGHIMYLAAVFPMSSHRVVCIAAAVILTMPVMKWVFSRIKVNKLLKAVGIVYIGTVMLLNCVSLSVLTEDSTAFAGIFTAGAMMFLASDLLLVLNTFGDEYSQKIKKIYIGLYYSAQILIALSLHYL